MLTIIADALITASGLEANKPNTDYRDELRHKLYLDQQRRKDLQCQRNLALKAGSA